MYFYCVESAVTVVTATLDVRSPDHQSVAGTQTLHGVHSRTECPHTEPDRFPSTQWAVTINETVSLTVVLRPLAELLLLLPQLVAARRPVHAGEDSALRVAVVAGAPLGRAGHHIVLGGGGAT